MTVVRSRVTKKKGGHASFARYRCESFLVISNENDTRNIRTAQTVQRQYYSITRGEIYGYTINKICDIYIYIYMLSINLG